MFLFAGQKILELGANVVPFIVVLLIIVFVHEMGHFLIARHNGIQVSTFSVGYGPELYGFTDKKGTRWRISAIPIGGYVMMLGDADATSVKSDLNDIDEDNKDRTLQSKTPLQRIMVAFGGPLFNFLFTMIIIAGISALKGIPDIRTCVQSVNVGSVAEKCGVQPGDVITGIGGTAVSKVSEMLKCLKASAGTDIELRFLRGDEEHVVSASLYELNENGKKIAINLLGVALSGEMVFEQVSFAKSISYAVEYCYVSIKSITAGLARAIMGKKDGAKLGSVFSIGKDLNKSLKQGLVPFLSFMAMISLSLGFFNMLPIPVLDGGSIFLNSIELIIRRPLSAAVINVVYTIGLGIVASLMLFSLWNDFERFGFIKKALDFAKSLCGKP
jgi:regulator of sigma E protease